MDAAVQDAVHTASPTALQRIVKDGLMKIVSFPLEQGNKYFAKVDGLRFFVGARVPYDGGKGLMNTLGSAAQRYERGMYRDEFGFWADFIHPTATAEGALFHTLTTYDRARFTFTFLQFAAHVPDGDFVRYFRRLLSLQGALDYCPDLRVLNGRVSRLEENAPQALQSATSTDGLLDYLNPSRTEVEDTEVIQAAKFIHWVLTDAAHRRLQVEVGVDEVKYKVANYAKRYNFDGCSDVVCMLVVDIRHQGRAKSEVIAAALQSTDPVRKLLEIGASRYPNRIATLRREVKRLSDDGTSGKRKCSLSKGEFIPA